MEVRMTDVTPWTASIYFLLDPLTREVRYVGMTVYSLKDRLNGHLRYKGKDHKSYWIKSLKDRGLIPEIVLVKTVSIDDRADEEQKMIGIMRDLGARLTNSTKGGVGALGYKHSAEAKDRMSRSKKGKPSPKKGMPISEEQRAKLSESTARQMQDPERRAAISRVHKGKKISAEHRRIVSEAASKRWKEWRASGQHMSEESIERMREAAKNRPKRAPASEETRAKISAAKRLYWEQRRKASEDDQVPVKVS
jgi:hypothetical protein